MMNLFLRVVFIVSFFSLIICEHQQLIASPRPSSSEVYERELPLREQLDQGGNVVISWGFSSPVEIVFEIKAKAKGWVGFGISKTGLMRPADVVIGWVKDGLIFFAM
ncbi:hypothetical protein CHS0354_013562 [Potamilus streckersoni]|uniref:DOMON domain-containing protein n=1 Tax=Potamilus streckersoni TaxID=2493646 RepID=A0AAE0SL00_9BIVA|nr:hypothetical protein CHS0354_013562 [Potamilus streckersoni]